MGDAARLDRNGRFIDAFNEMAVASCPLKVGDKLEVTDISLGELEGWAIGVYLFASVKGPDGKIQAMIFDAYGELYESDDCDRETIVERLAQAFSAPEDVVRAKIEEADLD